MKWKALAACTLAGLALIAAGCGGGDKAAAGGAKAGGQDLKGKKLVMYVSFHEDTAKELADLFKKQTGADVKLHPSADRGSSCPYHGGKRCAESGYLARRHGGRPCESGG